MTTTFPAAAFPLMGDVVIFSPLRKLTDPLILPVIDPSGFCFQRDSCGTPFGGACVTDLGEGADVSGWELALSFDLLPKKEKDGFGVSTGDSTGGGVALVDLDPKRETVGFSIL